VSSFRYIAKAKKKDEIVAAAHNAAVAERDTYEPASERSPHKPAGTDSGSASTATATVAAAGSSGGEGGASLGVATAAHAQALALEHKRNPNGYALSQAYEMRIASELKTIKSAGLPAPSLSAEEQRALRDARIPPPFVASTSISDALESFRLAAQGDNAALHRVFAGW
jgi:hypothetical protein